MPAPPGCLDPAFSAWLAEAGVRTSPAIQAVLSPHAGGGRAIQALAPLVPGEELVALPERSLLSSSLACERDPAFAAAVAAERATPAAASSSSLTDEAVLAAYLLTQAAAGPASPWALFLASLPPSYPLLGAWGPGAVSALACPAAAAAARRARDELDQAWRAASRLLTRVLGEEGGAWARRAPCMWAVGSVRTRSMFFSEAHPAGVLVPFADLFNHGPPPAGDNPDTGGACGACAGWHAAPGVCPGGGGGGEEDRVGPPHAGPCLLLLSPPPPPPGIFAAAVDARGRCWGDGAWDAASKTYRITARARYEPGHEVRLCYGPHPNLALLTHYGFTLPDGSNPCDTATLLEIDFPPSLGEDLEGVPLTIHACGAPGWALLSALRRAAVARAGLPPQARGAALAAAAEGRAASAATDAAALGALARAADAAAARLEGREKEVQPNPAPPPSPSSFAGECLAAARAWRAGQVAVLKRAAAQARRAAVGAAETAAASGLATGEAAAAGGRGGGGC
jgi:hypothetical protein